MAWHFVNPAFSCMFHFGTAVQDSLGHANGQQLHEPHEKQCVAEGKCIGHAIRQQDEEQASAEAADVEPKFLTEDVGELIAMLNGRHRIDHLHLDRKIRDVVQWPAEKQTDHKDKHSRRVEE